MKFIVAEKLEMSQIFKENGTVVPVTLLKADPCVVTQIKNEDKDGYIAVQVGRGNSKHPTKPMQGHVKASGGKAFSELKEFCLDEAPNCQVGDTISADVFVPGEFVQVVGISKGKGFQGVVKRHHFSGGPASHGHKDNLRMPGSIGSGGMQRVFKGMLMGGRMGGDRVTVKNLQVVEVDGKNGIIAIKGAVPGARGATILVSGGHSARRSWK